MQLPDVLYKILPLNLWQESQNLAELKLDKSDENFIHFSLENQVDRIIQKYFTKESYVLLKIDPKKLEGRLVFEANPGGVNKYYHLYEGSIPTSSVLEASVEHSSSQDVLK